MLPLVIQQFLPQTSRRKGQPSPRDCLLEGEDIFGSESEAKRIKCWLWLVTEKENEVPATSEVLFFT